MEFCELTGQESRAKAGFLSYSLGSIVTLMEAFSEFLLIGSLLDELHWKNVDSSLFPCPQGKTIMFISIKDFPHFQRKKKAELPLKPQAGQGWPGVLSCLCTCEARGTLPGCCVICLGIFKMGLTYTECSLYTRHHDLETDLTVLSALCHP